MAKESISGKRRSYDDLMIIFDIIACIQYVQIFTMMTTSKQILLINIACHRNIFDKKNAKPIKNAKKSRFFTIFMFL